MTQASGAHEVVVISGAANGLGRALALRYAKSGAALVLLDKDAEGAARLAHEIALHDGASLAITCDVTDEGACAAAVAQGHTHFGRIDVLINNAGISHRSPFATTQTAVLRRVMEVNLYGAIHLTRAALPFLRQSHGTIVAISSVAGFTPLIARTGYAASKHAVHGFFESLRTELAPDGVHVMIACPAFIATGIDRNALGADGKAVTHGQLVVGKRLDPAAVADRIFTAARRRKRLLLVGRTAWGAWWLSRFAPAWYERIMARRLRGEMG